MPSYSGLRATAHSKLPAPRRSPEKPRLLKMGMERMRSRIADSIAESSAGLSPEYGASTRPGASFLSRAIERALMSVGIAEVHRPVFAVDDARLIFEFNPVLQLRVRAG